MRLHALCTCLLMGPLILLAQPKWEAGLAIGGAGYQGDLAPDWHPEWEEVNRAYGLFLRHHLATGWALRLNLSYAELSGDDRNFSEQGFDIRNFRFQSQAGQAALLLEWEPFGWRRYPDTAYFRGLISPYVFAGAGLAYLDAGPDFSKTRLDDLQPLIEADRREPFPQTHLAVPFGIGIKLDLSPVVLLGLEASATTAFTDYIDGISHAGKPGTNDWISYAGATLSFRFVPKDADRDGIADKEDACPQVKGSFTALGCPDQDRDGVEDLEDLCPDDAGPRQLNGCPDTDGDGVADREDRCPLIPGTLPTLGCPDSDQDGIANQDDECPRLPGPKGRRGCPVLDADADGELADEPEICMLSSEAALLQQIDQFTRPAFSFLRCFRPVAKLDFLSERTDEEPQQTATGFFD
ncbi:MAG: thrombospondin type 3 repeat-containing protein [Phaeodactylibacter sp.]|nr:thrombospondin type 3 repeat-containing protein [Phaeodactylibacter sp.]